MTIQSLMNQIKNNEIVLPAIQRNFVWGFQKIEKLMDSIMREYPIGLILMWETYEKLQFRKFDSRFISGSLPIFADNHRKRLKVVLDGQQRLQSLYIALQGSIDKKELYFDVLSGLEADDFEEEKFVFRFSDSKQIKMMNSSDNKKTNDRTISFSKVKKLFDMTTNERHEFKSKLTKKLNLDKDEVIRLDFNLSKLDEVITKNNTILKTSVIDENKALKSKDRKTQSDVLEIFVRINRQGTPLSRSDLIFSMLKLNWKESSTALPEFVEQINKGNSFGLDIDFVIRCLFAVSDLGTKFDIDLLRRKSNLLKMQSNFDRCCEGIKSTVDYVQQYCWVSNGKSMGGTSSLVPFVYYFSNLKSYSLPNDQIENFRKAFFLFAFARPFSRYADSRLARFIADELKPLTNEGDSSFPFNDAMSWCNYWEDVKAFDGNLIGKNHLLALHLIQENSGAKTQRNLNSREVDHIFPRSELRNKSFEPHLINHFANYWILSKGKNINKSAKHPKKYFSDVPISEMKRALIEPEMLDYRKYKNFLQMREDAIVLKLKNKIGFTDADFEFEE